MNRITATLMLSAALIIGPGVGASQALAQKVEAKQKTSGYYCVMDRDVKSDKPGRCPKWGMDLRPIENDADSTPSSISAEAPDTEFKLQIPDVTVFDQDGKQLRFFTDLVKDKTVAINFIF